MAELSSTKIYGDLDVAGDVKVASTSIMTKLNSFVGNDVVYNGVTVLTSSTIVDVFLYNTVKDSDSGAWRLNCQNKSWFNEPLNTAARGKTREFPAVVLVVIETTKATIFDATQDNCPMWMVFNGSPSNPFRVGPTSVTAMDGVLYFAFNGGSGLSVVNFIKDSTTIHAQAATYKFNGDISDRNDLLNFYSTGAIGVLNGTINDVAVCVRPGSPIDSLTGLPVPTIAVATLAGVTIIDGYAGVGTFVDDVFNSTNVVNVSIFDDKLFYSFSNSWFGGPLSAFTADLSTSSTSTWETTRSGKAYWDIGTSNTIPAPIYTSTNDTKSLIAGKAFGSLRGLTLLKEWPAAYANGMITHISDAHNTGWMRGDIRRAMICEALGTTDSLTASTEMVTSLANYGGVYDYETLTVSGKDVTSAINTTGSGIIKSNKLNLIIGRTYQIVINLTLNSGTAPFVSIKDSAHTNSGGVSNWLLVNGTNTLNFTYTTADCDYFYFYNSSTVTNFSATNSIKEIVLDRSVKKSALTINGTLSRSPVATGSELQCIGPFSAANYLSQAYSADLDFGTGDFHMSGWIRTPTTGSSQYVIARWAGSGSGFLVEVRYDGKINALISDDYFVTSDGVTTNSIVSATVFCKFDFVRRSGNLELWFNGSKEHELPIVNATNSLSSAGATFKLGDHMTAGSAPYGGTITMIRLGVGAPDPTQIVEMYRTEKEMFNTGVKCTLQGSYASTSVNCLSYDERYNALLVGTVEYAVAFRDLVIDGDYYSKTGNVKSVSADDGMVLEGTTLLTRFTAASNVFDGRLSGGVSGGVSTGSTTTTNSYKLTGATTLVAGNEYMLDTSAGSFTVTLPLTASVDDKIVIYDLMGTFDTNSPIVARNGHVIMGLAENVTLDLENSKTELVYSGVTNGWRLYIVANLTPTENKLINMDATGLSTIVLDAEKYDVFNISNLTTGDTLDMSNIPVGKTVMVTLNAPGAITIAFSETVKWPGGAAPTHGSGWEIMVFTRVSSTVLLGSSTLAHA